MRRTTALLLTSLLASAAALAAPTAAEARAGADNPTTGSCVAYPSGPFGVGVCSGLEPRRAWSVSAKCMSGLTVTSGLRLGDGTATANCGNSRVYTTQVSIGPILP
ncbi:MULTISPECIES: hypothetical protein [unclassified Kitasatospora]|uniref:hypothetical protein n=1 Tax=unclassified Kitasatospora TaxID=2633591 RepID=UPI002E350C20|nr:hypothetical protein [Kitasatospora sp. NBC_01246]